MSKRLLGLGLLLACGGMLAWNHYLHETAHRYFRMPLILGPSGILVGLFVLAVPDPDPRARWVHVVSWLVMGVGLLCTAWLWARY